MVDERKPDVCQVIDSIVGHCTMVSLSSTLASEIQISLTFSLEEADERISTVDSIPNSFFSN